MRGDQRDAEVVGEVIHIDGRHYRNVVFRDCTLIYSGGGIPVFEDCADPGSTYRFDDAARRTLLTLTSIFSAWEIFRVLLRISDERRAAQQADEAGAAEDAETASEADIRAFSRGEFDPFMDGDSDPQMEPPSAGASDELMERIRERRRVIEAEGRGGASLAPEEEE